MTLPQQDIEKALVLHRSGQLDQAEQIYLDVLQREPARFDAILLLGTVHLQRGDAGKALEKFDRALAIVPDSPDACCNRGHALRVLHRSDEALRAYEAAIARKPDHFEAAYHHARLLQDLHRPADAVAAYDRLLTFKPDAAQALHNRGVSLHALGRLDDALRSCDQALAISPGMPSAWHSRGNILLELERFQEARASLDRAIELRPDDVDAFSSRGRLKLLTGEFATGWRISTTASVAMPSHKPAASLSGRARNRAAVRSWSRTPAASATPSSSVATCRCWPRAAPA